MLKANSKATLDIIAGQKKQNATEAYLQTHPTANVTTARTNAYKLMKKPEAQIYLQKHVDKARARIVELVETEDGLIALKASQDILDREYGKATIVNNSSNTVVLVQPILAGSSVIKTPTSTPDHTEETPPIEGELA